MEASERINIILKKLDIDATTLKKNLVKYLVQIEEVLEQKRTRRRELLKELTESDYTVKSIAQETGISRTTFYSYDGLLQKYVELSHDEDYRDDLYEQIKSLKEKVHRLQEEKTLMAKRDCQELLLRAENKLLKEQLADRDKTINSLRCTIIRRKN
jgi:transposase-like protein